MNPLRFLQVWRVTLRFAMAVTLAGPLPAASQSAAPTTPANVTTLVKADNAFAFDLYGQFKPGAADNAFFSPYSISTALGMTWAGAQGDTAAQMAQTLHFTEVPTGQTIPAFEYLQKELATAQKKSGIQLALANSLWPQEGFKILPDYLKLVQAGFDSVITPVNYQKGADAVRQHINTWVADKTSQRIKNLLAPADVTASTKLVLVNAIYFKGNWTEKFDPKATAPAPFTRLDGTSESTALMHKKFKGVGYADVSDGPVPLQILSLPYKDGALEFVALLPKLATALPDLEKSLTAAQLATWLDNLAHPHEVEVFLPKFKLNTRYGLKAPLQALGMVDAFDTQADFSGMTGKRDLLIGSVVHQAFVEVNEEGTEAAAATGVIMMPTMVMQPQPTPVFRADHPFLFFIRDATTGSILFMGRLAAPDAAN